MRLADDLDPQRTRWHHERAVARHAMDPRTITAGGPPDRGAVLTAVILVGVMGLALVGLVVALTRYMTR
jgi:hypothetical protein